MYWCFNVLFSVSRDQQIPHVANVYVVQSERFLAWSDRYPAALYCSACCLFTHALLQSPHPSKHSELKQTLSWQTWPRQKRQTRRCFLQTCGR